MHTGRHSWQHSSDPDQNLRGIAAAALSGADPDCSHNGRVYTVHPGTAAAAIAIRDGRILALAPTGKFWRWRAKNAARRSGQRRVLPGFNDAHATRGRVVWSSSKKWPATRLRSTRYSRFACPRRRDAADVGEGYLYDDGKTPRPLTRAIWTPRCRIIRSSSTHRGGHTATSTPRRWRRPALPPRRLIPRRPFRTRRRRAIERRSPIKPCSGAGQNSG